MSSQVFSSRKGIEDATSSVLSSNTQVPQELSLPVSSSSPSHLLDFAKYFVYSGFYNENTYRLGSLNNKGLVLTALEYGKVEVSARSGFGESTS